VRCSSCRRLAYSLLHTPGTRLAQNMMGVMSAGAAAISNVSYWRRGEQARGSTHQRGAVTAAAQKQQQLEQRRAPASRPNRCQAQYWCSPSTRTCHSWPAREFTCRTLPQAARHGAVAPPLSPPVCFLADATRLVSSPDAAMRHHTHVPSAGPLACTPSVVPNSLKASR
jgi:hypothetical protein